MKMYMKILILSVTSLSMLNAGLSGKKVGIDPGHGGIFPGAINSIVGIKEKDVTLAIAKEVKKYLEKDGARVLMTREYDTQLNRNANSDLISRTNYLNSNKVDISVSIHNNSSSNKRKNDIESFISCGKCGTSSASLGDSLLDELTVSTGLFRGYPYPKYLCSGGVKQCSGMNGVGEANFHMVREIKNAPATLIELAFISNDSQAKKFKDSNYIKNQAYSIYSGIAEYFGQTPIPKGNVSFGISRADAVKLILDKFSISPRNAGFNNYIFGKPIHKPNDVSRNTKNYDYIVVAYNRGIVNGNNGSFEPNRSISLQEFITMIVRAIPIPLNNPKYKEYPHMNRSNPFYKYVRAAFNAGLIEDAYFNFQEGVTGSDAGLILNDAYRYFKGSKSGISIYAKWYTKYADIDLYLYDKTNGSIDLKLGSDGRTILNMKQVRNSKGIVYWGKNIANWGAALDYDSWGGNGKQPWPGFAEERVTVDSLMVKRPGRYNIIMCYYPWDRYYSLNYRMPSKVTVEWWGINAGRNINVGGKNFYQDVNKGKCVYAGRLNTN